MKITQLGKFPIYHVDVKDPWTLAMTFLRMQEHYESPKFRGQAFTLESYMDWYAHARPAKGAFTYPKDWTGFNVPSRAVSFVYAKMKPWTMWERQLFTQLEDMRLFPFGPRFYLIGTSDAAADLPHELRHGMYDCDIAYRAIVNSIVKRYLSSIKPFTRWLLSKDYTEETLIDEIQAWALTGWPEGVRVTKVMREMRRELKSVERRFLPKGMK